jgi:protein gp37
MATETKIEWADHTWNPWIGCTRVSAACENCYAATMAHRRGWAQFVAGAPRHRTSKDYWRQPLIWNRRAAASGVRESVFPSLCDPFDAEVSDAWRDDLFETAEKTPSLDWLLLTKRPKVARGYFSPTSGRKVPANVRLGVTAENQTMADLRIPQLLAIDAPAFFVSVEPMLSAVDLSNLDHRGGPGPDYGGGWFDALSGVCRMHDGSVVRGPSLDWVIAGGESGPRARPAHPDWFRALRDRCVAAGVPFFFKQWGEWAPGECADGVMTRPQEVAWYDRCCGGAWSHGRVTPRQSEEMHRDDEPDLYRMGKRRAGARLDGREWREMPLPAARADPSIDRS